MHKKQLKNGDYHGIIRDCKKRHSVRKYTGKEIEQEKLDKTLEAAHAAPTAANMQPVRLMVVKSKEGLEKVGKAANIYQAPAAHCRLCR